MSEVTDHRGGLLGLHAMSVDPSCGVIAVAQSHGLTIDASREFIIRDPVVAGVRGPKTSRPRWWQELPLFIPLLSLLCSPGLGTLAYPAEWIRREMVISTFRRQRLAFQPLYSGLARGTALARGG